MYFDYAIISSNRAGVGDSFKLLLAVHFNDMLAFQGHLVRKKNLYCAPTFEPHTKAV